jgi:uncharacterized membrane protein YjgN (DUF898 family)
MTTSYVLDTALPESPSSGQTLRPHSAVERISFTGTGSEYFRIWIVNLLLTIVTLGIYSAWAKVRRTRYFYDNTRLAGSSFEYHGNPVAILKGRIAAVILFGGYQVAFYFSTIAGFAMLALLVLLVPWLIWKSLQFKLHNSSYRGIRFGFRGTARRAYFAYMLLPFLSLISLYTLVPFAHQRIKKFQHEESRFGTSHFSFNASIGGFYLTYLIGVGLVVAGLVMLAVAFGGTLMAIVAAGGSFAHAGASVLASFAFFVIGIYVWMFSIYPLMLTLLQNLIWNGTALQGHRFSSAMKWPRVTWIALSNMVGVIVTLGLFIPFAQIRMMKYRLESMSLLPDGDLDSFIAGAQAEAPATGEGVADLLDFDMSL